MREARYATVALRREAMKPRLKEVTPFSRYSREEVALMRMLVAEHRCDLNPGHALAQCNTLLAKLEDDLKMRP